MADNIHTPEDGRGQRRVFVDGNLVEYVFYADTDAGEVRAYVSPLVVENGEIKKHVLRGKVEVVPYG